LTGLIPPFPCHAADEPLEYEVKAAFLLNFTKFIEWPASAFESPDSPLSICILGDDPFGSTLDQIVAGEIVAGRRVAAQRIKRAPPAQFCQVLFVNASDKDAPKMLRGLGPGVLTVGEGATFLHDGGMIAFAIENRRVRFDINRTAAENAGLKLSSKLLSVARVVEK
jgi:YfiR/HmsC-like